MIAKLEQAANIKVIYFTDWEKKRTRPPFSNFLFLSCPPFVQLSHSAAVPLTFRPPSTPHPHTPACCLPPPLAPVWQLCFIVVQRFAGNPPAGVGQGFDSLQTLVWTQCSRGLVEALLNELLKFTLTPVSDEVKPFFSHHIQSTALFFSVKVVLHTFDTCSARSSLFSCFNCILCS